MIKTSDRKQGLISSVIGAVLLFIGISCNEWTLGILSTDHVLSAYTKVKIWTLDIFFILAGLSLVNYKKSKKAFLRLSLAHPRTLDALIGIILAVTMLLCAEWGIFHSLNYYQLKKVSDNTRPSFPCKSTRHKIRLNLLSARLDAI